MARPVDPRLNAIQETLHVDYRPSRDVHDIVVRAELDAPYPYPRPGHAIKSFVDAVGAGAFCGSAFAASSSAASIVSGSIDQLGPSLEFRIRVRGMDSLAIRVLVDALSWALGLRQIRFLEVVGGADATVDGARLDTRALQQLLRDPAAYPGRSGAPAVKVKHKEAGAGCSVFVKCATALSEGEVDRLEWLLATWRNAVALFLTGDGEDPELPLESVVPRTARSTRAYAQSYADFPHHPASVLPILGNVLDRAVFERLPIASVEVRA
jgi:hypothetical protein